MNTREVLEECARLKIRLSLVSEQLRVRVPKGVDAAELLLQLKEKKAEVISALSAAAPIPTHVATPSDRFPLSHSQAGLWFLSELNPGGAEYNMPGALRIQGHLDTAALDRALRWLVERHTSLRTVFGSDENGVGYQRILTLDEWPGLHAVTLPEDITSQQYLEREAKRPFNLESGPLFRTELLELGQDDFALFMSLHHIIADGWSMGVMTRELGAAYQSFVHTNAPPGDLPPPPIQFTDYSAWQRKWFTEARLSQELAYWREQLQGAAPLELATDRPRPKERSHQGAHVAFSLDPTLTRELEAFAKSQQATLFMVLLAGFATLLGRSSDQTDVVVGSPVANRTRAETQGSIGFYLNTLAFRAQLDGDPTFSELVAQIRTTSMEAQAHQSTPFETVVRALDLPRDPSRSPVFQAMFVLQNAPVGELNFGHSLTVTPLSLGGGTAKFDLLLDLSRTATTLSGYLEYCTALWDPGSIERLLKRFSYLSRAAVRAPSLPISSLPMAAPEELRQTVEEWNQTAVDHPGPQLIHKLFEDTVRKTPEGIALKFSETEVTYAELNVRANQLAHRLQGLGVGPDTRVGVALDRGLHLPVALLAILKAGGAYVPLDPQYPEERLQFMAEDAGIAVLVTDSHVPEIPLALAFEKLVLDEISEELAELQTHNPGDQRATDPSTHPQNLAYIVYTSGSTGRPKGVGTPHRAVVRLVAKGLLKDIGPSDVFLQFAPVAFDASTLEFWGALTRGATLAIVPPGLPSLEDLESFIVSQRVSAAWLTAGLFRRLLEAHPDCVRGVRNLWAGGDVLSQPQAVAAAKHSFGSVYNGYGPTETTTFATNYRVRPSDEDTPVLPIGAALPETSLYVLDAQLAPCAIGVPGELCIGGEGLARGYLGRPDLTAERFIPNPFGAPSERLYRSGDRVRWRGDGNLEFLGRLDDQIKIRGFRIELGEIELSLASMPSVRQCIVLAREDTPGHKRLVAYIVAEAPDAPPAVDRLRAELSEQLPEHMVPSAFVVLPVFPLTTNGKIDRKALPAPDGDRSQLSAEYEAPRTHTEEALVELWEKLLATPKVGIHDNFFALGGDSILTVQLVAAAKKSGIAMTPADLFAHQNVARLAAHITGEVSKQDADPDENAPEGDLWLQRRPGRAPAAQVGGEPTLLLTGATGFVGIHLLAEFMSRSDLSVVSLVRAETEKAAQKKLLAAAEHYGLSPDLAKCRVALGDLAMPQLALSGADFARLATGLTAVVHNGARVNHMLPYSALRDANVGSTRELIALAATAGATLHYISTLSVFDPSVMTALTLAPEGPAPRPSDGSGGYSLSKWTAEHLLEIARAQGVRAGIFRLGQVGAHTDRGILPVENYRFAQALRAMFLTGFVPDAFSNGLEFSPAEFVSAGVSAGVETKDLGTGYFHVEHPNRLSFSELRQGYAEVGYPLRLTDLTDWRWRVHRVAERLEDEELRLFSLLMGGNPDDAEGTPEPEGADPSAAPLLYGHQNFERLTSEAGLSAGPLSVPFRAMLLYIVGLEMQSGRLSKVTREGAG